MKNNREAVEKRHRELLQIITEAGEISVAELAQKMNVTPMTIRRDLHVLAAGGNVVHAHGKAVSAEYAAKGSREDEERNFCRDILSSYAAGLVEDGDTLFINGSRTALNLLHYIPDRSVTAITNNGWAVDGNYPDNIRIRLIGGDIYDHVMVGEYVVQSLLRMHADKLFIGCAAIYEDGEFRYDIPTEIGINEMMISRTRGKTYILADHTKLQKRTSNISSYGSCRYTVPVTLITDEMADPAILSRLRDSGIEIVTVPVPVH